MADERLEKSKAIDLALTQIEKQFGKGSIMRLGNKEAIVPISVISTGSISFDAALGVGGFPRGRVVEILVRNRAARQLSHCRWWRKRRSKAAWQRLSMPNTPSI